MLQSTITRVYRHGHLFAGIGAGAKGFNQARPRVGNMVARWECAGGIDVDPGAIRNFERLTGVPGTVMDLFSRDQYRAFHGLEPEWNWREAVPADIRAALGALTCMLLSPPCKGFSGLLSQAKSLTEKYQALNALTLRGIWLTLEAYKDDPIRIILIENVPRIQTRGRWLLDQIIALLRAYGYSVNEDRHDCGELGHLAQSRKRFILIARHAERVPPFIYQPRKYPLRGVGEVIGQMPLPGDPLAGPMHRVPSLQWQTWVRLAFVEAGSDWRSLNKLAVEDGVLRDYGIRPEAPLRDNAYGVCRWEDRSPLVTSARAPGQGRFSVADPRAFCSRDGSGYLGVRHWIDHVGVVSSRGGPTNGSFSVADPRPGYREGTHTNLLSVASYDAAARVVSGAAHVAGGALSVADPCDQAQGRGSATAGAHSLTFTVADPTPGYGPATHRHVLGVVSWAAATGVVTGSPKPTTGAHSVADPRVNGHPASVQLGVRTWDRPAGVVTANMWVGSGPNAVSDPRAHRSPTAATFRIVAITEQAGAVADPRAREGHHPNGKYRVCPYDSPANAVIGASTTGMGAFVVADPIYRAGEMGQYANKMRVVPATAAAPTVTGSDRVGSGALSVADPRPRGLARGDRQNYLSQSHYGIVGWSQHTKAIPGHAKDNNGSWSIADPREAEAPSQSYPKALPAKDDRLVARIVALDGTWHRPFTSAELLVIQGILDSTEYVDLIGTSDAEKREWVGNAIPPPASCSIATTVGETLLLADSGERFTLSPREIWVKPGALPSLSTTARRRSISTGLTHGSCDRSLGTRRRPQSDPQPAGDRRASRSRTGRPGGAPPRAARPAAGRASTCREKLADAQAATRSLLVGRRSLCRPHRPVSQPSPPTNEAADATVRPVMLTDRTQRWRDRRSLFVSGDTMIDPSRYAVDIVDHTTARAFISDHHYLPRYPAAQVAVGLFGPGAAGRPALSGLIVFGVPATGAVITRHTGFSDPAQGCVLQRLLCLPSVAANGESFFASRAFRLLRLMRPRIEAVVSFSDPAFGHCGGVYAALSGAYRGRTRPRQVLRIAGETISDRTLSKIRNLESGHAGAIDQLVRLGAPGPRPMEHPRAWLDRCREAHILTSARQSPLFTYCFELTRRARRTGGPLPRLAYPIRSDVLREQLGT